MSQRARPLPRRLCPCCGDDSGIDENGALWPRGWRCSACGFHAATVDDFVQLAPEFDEVDEGFDLELFNLLAPLEAKHFWFVSRNELIRWLVERHAPSAHRVLEIGCGTGFVLHALRAALPQARIAGSELHSQGLRTARERHGEGVELFQMDARRSGLADVLDLVGAFDVLEHIREDEAVLCEIGRMLKPGGVLIATAPQHPWMWSATDDMAHHQRRYRVGELARKATTAGLEKIYNTSFTTLAFPLMVASRLWARGKNVPPTLQQQTEAEYILSPTATKSMLTLSRIEQRLRTVGVPLPFGGSQVLVARRPQWRR
jgi:SAM-dependent methyltransferase